MNRALIASSATDASAVIEQLLKTEGFAKTAAVPSGNEARRIIMREDEPELIVINTPLSDEFGLELAITASEYTYAGIILVCDSDIIGEISDKLAENSIFVLTRPLDRLELVNAVNDVMEARAHITGPNRESVGLLTKIDEMRLINRAKSTLMQYLNFTEHQAHKYIEKQAMNNRKTRLEAALKILEDYKK